MSLPKNLTLNNGLVCPIIGLGTCAISNVEEVVYQSIKDGTRLIDTASIYKNEEDVGKGIKRAIDEGLVKREDLFVTTKCWVTEKGDPEKALKNSLERLKLTYVDLYLDHWPCGKDYTGQNKIPIVSVKELWTNFEKLVEQGLTKSIGLSNYNVQNILNILSFCKIKPVINEVEFNPYLYQKELKEFCDKENIKIFAYNPLGKGVYCKKYEKIIEEQKLDLLNEDVVKELAKKYEKTPGQIILNWYINLRVITIPGTSKPERMKENLVAVDFEMKKEDYEALSNFGKSFRFCGSFDLYGVDIFA